MKDKLLNYLNPIKGVSYKPSELRDSYEKDCFYLLRSNNIKNNNVNFDDIQIVKPGVVNNSQKLQPKDIVVCMSNGSKRLVGKNAQFKTKNNNYCVGAFCGGFRAKDFSKSDYLFQLFQSDEYQNYLDVTLAGSAINNLKSSDILKFEFYFPNPDYQQKIAKILNTIDAVIDKTEHAIAKYQAIKKGMMHDLFTRGIDVKTGQLRPSFDDAPELYKESVLGMIPKDWAVKRLDQITNYVDYRGKTPSKSDRGTFLITAKNVKNGYIDYDISKEYIPTKNFESVMSRGKASIGDVLITTEAPLGNVAQIDRENIALAQRVIKYKGKDSSLNNTFLKYNFLSDYFQAKIYQESTGSTVLGIKGSKLHIVKIKLPQPEEQIKISKKLIQVDRLIQKEQKILAKNQNIKKGLMQDLLTGKVEVKV